jgi:hypothetical protein
MAAALFLLAAPLQAQVAVPKYAIAGGGGTSSSIGGYAVTGTVGEPAAGTALTGGTYSVVGGFWRASADVRPHTPFTDPILTSGLSTIRAIHITELRQRINAVRAHLGLTAYSFTDPTLAAGLTTAKALHITDLRTALSQAYVAAGRPLPVYSAPAIGAGATIRAADITELRTAVVAIE